MRVTASFPSSSELSVRTSAPAKALNAKRTEAGRAPTRGSSLVLWGLLLATACQRKSAPEGPPPAAPPVKISGERLELAPQERFADYLAELSATRAVVLHPQVTGYVRRILAKPGETVKAGATLVQIDGAAEAASLENLQATHASLQASAAFARDRFERASRLRADGIVSQQDLDQAKAQVDQAEAALKASEASMASQKTRVGHFTIAAPIDGVVGDVPVRVGDFVTPSTALTSITQAGELEVDLHIPIERVRELGPDSVIRLLGPDGAPLGESPIIFISPNVDPSTQLVQVRGGLPLEVKVKPGQVLRARLVFTKSPGLSLPAAAITRQAGRTFVFVVDEGKAQRVAVTLGPLNDNRYLLEAGLDAGVLVASSGLQQLQDGAAVDLEKPKEGP